MDTNINLQLILSQSTKADTNQMVKKSYSIAIIFN